MSRARSLLAGFVTLLLVATQVPASPLALNRVVEQSSAASFFHTNPPEVPCSPAPGVTVPAGTPIEDINQVKYMIQTNQIVFEFFWAGKAHPTIRYINVWNRSACHITADFYAQFYKVFYPAGHPQRYSGQQLAFQDGHDGIPAGYGLQFAYNGPACALQIDLALGAPSAHISGIIESEPGQPYAGIPVCQQTPAPTPPSPPAAVAGNGTCAPANAGQNLVQNPSFEQPTIVNPKTQNLWAVYGGVSHPQFFDAQPSIPGWAPDQYQVELQRSGLFGTAFHGVQYAEVDAPGQKKLRQALSTEPATEYLVTFAYALRPDIAQGMNVLWNNQVIGTMGGNGPASGLNWQCKSFRVVSTGNQSELGFAATPGSTTGAGNLIDHVTVTKVGPVTADLSIILTGPSSVTPGSTVTYQVAATNNGPATTYAATITYDIPSTLTFLSSSDPQQCSLQGNQVKCVYPNGFHSVGATGIVNFTFRVAQNACGSQFSNTVSLASPNVTDPNLSNNQSTVVTSVTGCSSSSSSSSATPQCRDGIDNDGDGKTDSSDPGCHSDGNPYNSGSYVPDDNDESNPATTQCNDGVDNADPEDSLVDLNDPGCHSDGNANNAASYVPLDTDETNAGTSSSSSSVSSAIPQCRDGIDNDNDGKTDSSDPGCHSDGNPYNPGSYVPDDNDESNPATTQCNDGVDNADPEDSLVDFNDPGCHSDGNANNASSYVPLDTDETNAAGSSSSASSTSSSVPQCRDGIDNDNDGATDHPNDFSCSGPDDNDETNPKAQCQDGIDNDGDGLIDFGQDPGCSSRQDNDETNGGSSSSASSTSSSSSSVPQCRDGKDNDNDGAIDFPSDFSCSGPDDNDETNPKSQCQDGIDNDGDGRIDFGMDFGCISTQDNDESDAFGGGAFFANNPFVIQTNIPVNVVNNNNVTSNADAAGNANANTASNANANPYAVSYMQGGSSSDRGGRNGSRYSRDSEYIALLPQTGVESFTATLSGAQSLMTPAGAGAMASSFWTILGMLGVSAGGIFGKRFL